MKKSLRLLSLILAVLMMVGSMSVLGHAYQAFRGDGVSLTYDDVNKPTFTAEQYATMALDELDRFLAEKDMFVNIVIDDLDLRGVDVALNSVKSVYSGASNLLPLLGDAKNIDLSAVIGADAPRRNVGSPNVNTVNGDLQVLWSVLNLLSDLSPIVYKYVNHTLDLNFLNGLVSDYMFDIRELVIGLLYGISGMGDTVDQEGNTVEYDYFDSGAGSVPSKYTTTGGTMVFLQELLNKLVLGEWTKLDDMFYQDIDGNFTTGKFAGKPYRSSNVVFSEYMFKDPQGNDATGPLDTATYDYYGWVHEDRWVTFGLGDAIRVPNGTTVGESYSKIDIDGAANVYDLVEPLLLQAYNGIAVPVLQRITLNWIREKLGYKFDSKYETLYVKDLVGSDGKPLYTADEDLYYDPDTKNDPKINPDYNYLYHGTEPEGGLATQDSAIFQLFGGVESINIPYAEVDPDITSDYGTFIKALNHNAYRFVQSVLSPNTTPTSRLTQSVSGSTTTFTFDKLDADTSAVLASYTFDLVDGTNDNLLPNAIQLVKFVLKVTGNEFFSDTLISKNAVKTTQEIQDMGDQELLSYILRSVLNASVDYMWIPDEAPYRTLAGAGIEAVRQLCLQDIPQFVYTIPQKGANESIEDFNARVVPKALSMLMDLAAYNLNGVLDTNKLETATNGTYSPVNTVDAQGNVTNDTGLLPFLGDSGVYGTTVGKIAQWAVTTYACSSGDSNYGPSSSQCLLNIGLNSNTSGTVTEDMFWADIDTILNSILPIKNPAVETSYPNNKPWIYGGISGAPYAAKTLVFDYLVYPILNLNLTNIFHIFDRNTAGGLAQITLEKALVDTLHRIFDLLFPDVFTNSIDEIDGILNNGLLASMARDLLITLSADRASTDYFTGEGADAVPIVTTNGGVITGRGKLIVEIALPIVCMILGLSDEEYFSKLENYLPEFIDVAKANTTFKIYNGSGGVNSSYRNPSGYARTTDHLFNFTINSITAKDLVSSTNLNVTYNFSTLAGGQMGDVTLSGYDTGMLVEVQTRYTVSDENGNALDGGRVLVDTAYTYVGAKGDDEAELSSTIGGKTFKYVQNRYISGGLSGVDGFSIVFEDADDDVQKTATVTGVNVTRLYDGYTKSADNTALNWIQLSPKANKTSATLTGEGAKYILNPFVCDENAYRLSYEYQKDENGATVLDECDMGTITGLRQLESGEYYVDDGLYQVVTNISVDGDTGSITTYVHVYNDWGAGGMLDRLIGANLATEDIDGSVEGATTAWNNYYNTLKQAALAILPPKTQGSNFDEAIVTGATTHNKFEDLYRAMFLADKALRDGNTTINKKFINGASADGLWSYLNTKQKQNYTIEEDTYNGVTVRYIKDVEFEESDFMFNGKRNYVGFTYSKLKDAVNSTRGLIDRQWKYVGYTPEEFEKLTADEQAKVLETYSKQLENIGSISSVEAAYAKHRLDIAASRLIQVSNIGSSEIANLQTLLNSAVGSETNSGYTLATWNKYASAKQLAQDVLSNGGSPEKYNVAISMLVKTWKDLIVGAYYGALSSLYAEKVNWLNYTGGFGIVNDKIDTNGAANQIDYGNDEVTAFLMAMKRGENLLADSTTVNALSNLHQDEIDAAVEAINTTFETMINSTPGGDEEEATYRLAFDEVTVVLTDEVSYSPKLDETILSAVTAETYSSEDYGNGISLDGVIYGLPAGASDEDIAAMFDVDEGVSVIIENRKISGVNKTTVNGTGAFVIIYRESDDTVLGCYELAYRGDLNGDCNMTSADKAPWVRCNFSWAGYDYDQQFVLGEGEYNEAAYQIAAMDINGDGSYTSADFNMFKNALKTQKNINQRDGKTVNS
ncbi:MAG: hypothetical protein K6F64_02055 [Clostridia bacterium]|nr:hypothetical protein [Clostridia bacterium]